MVPTDSVLKGEESSQAEAAGARPSWLAWWSRNATWLGSSFSRANIMADRASRLGASYRSSPKGCLGD